MVVQAFDLIPGRFVGACLALADAVTVGRPATVVSELANGAVGLAFRTPWGAGAAYRLSWGLFGQTDTCVCVCVCV